jgi:hypothetical protein
LVASLERRMEVEQEPRRCAGQAAAPEFAVVAVDVAAAAESVAVVPSPLVCRVDMKLEGAPGTSAEAVPFLSRGALAAPLVAAGQGLAQSIHSS